MATTREPLLDLTTLIERPKIRIDGTLYEILSPDEITVVDVERFAQSGQRIASLLDGDGSSNVAALSAALDEVCDRIMVGVPDDVKAKLSVTQRLAIAEAFTQLQPTAASSRRVRRAAKSAGAKRSPDSNGSTAEIPGTGSPASRSGS
jgi:hypothetical protein